MARDQKDQRTSLNAELAHNYTPNRKKGVATPGRSALETETELDAVEPEVEEQGAEVEEQELAEREPKKSLFELPRKEPSRQPLLASPFGPQPSTPPAAPAAPATPPATTSKPKGPGPRRG